MKKKITTLIIAESGSHEERKWMDSLMQATNDTSEVIAICNGIQPFLNLKSWHSEKRLKPQNAVAEALKEVTTPFVVFHSWRDEATSSYQGALLDAINGPFPVQMKYQIDSSSRLFQEKPILSGVVFEKTCFNEIPFDFMFREDFHISTRKTNKIAFFHHDIEFFDKRSSIPVSLIVTIKNRISHWNLSMPFLVSQMGVPYELLFVDYFSEDGFSDRLMNYIEKGKESFSSDLKSIRSIRIKENRKFSSCRAKNLGARNARHPILAFTDIDTFLREDYLAFHVSELLKSTTTFCTNRAELDCRFSTEINYGNLVLYQNLYHRVEGHNETIIGYGGDDDELFHRLNLTGAKCVSPRNSFETRQYSLLHGDEARMENLEISELSGLQNWEFLKGKQSIWSTDGEWGRDVVDEKIFYPLSS